jgi:putative tricarboxylic transport membrane protein
LKRIQHPTSFITGSFLIFVACLALFLSKNLSAFTDIGLGPGFAPKVLAVLQVTLALPLLFQAFIEKGEPPSRFLIRPHLILVAVGYFAVTIERFGMVIALSGLVLIACAADKSTKPLEAVFLALGVVAFSYTLFVRALGLLIPIWPTFN